ncbi:MAG: FAD-binding oxidoreductase [Rhizobiaceae bacterium]|nr:FAD-binding oxidoreductase [Rhizobiaceae bacterium]
MANGRHIVVVGAGIVGASIAWHLVKAGARVTIVDGLHAGGIATPASFAWINASWGNPEPYFHLRMRAMREWKRVAAACPDIAISWKGGLIWDLPRGRLEAFAKEHASWGYGIRAVDRDEIARMEPALKTPPSFALHVAEEGAVEAAAAAVALTRQAEAAGAVCLRAPVTAIERKRGQVTVIAGGARLDADALVLAAGTATPELAALVGLDIPLDTPPGMIVHSVPSPDTALNGVVIAPNIAIRRTDRGRIIGSGEVGGSHPGDDPRRTARTLFRRVRSMLGDAAPVAFDFHTIGHRPMPKDGMPIVGWGTEGVYVAVTHSGVTLAPALGLFAADEILDDRRDALLRPFGPGRFAERANLGRMRMSML